MKKVMWLAVMLLVMLHGPLAGRADDGEGDWEDAQGVGTQQQAGDAEQTADPVPVAAPTEPVTDTKQYKCVVSGLPWNESSTRVLAIFRVNGERLRGRFVSLPYMLIQYKTYQEEGADVSIESVSVLDYASFNSGGERMIPVNDEWSNVVFVSTDTKLPGSKAPYYAAFSTAEDLEAAQKSLGGKVLSYEAVMKRTLAALRPDEPEEQAAQDEANDMRKHYKFGEPEVD
jgi:hypothetical protein